MIDKSKIKVCCICAESIKPKYLGKDQIDKSVDWYWYDGNNAEPIADGRCCDSCNSTVVIPQRITDLKLNFVWQNTTRGSTQ